jgi:hypothetical protein
MINQLTKTILGAFAGIVFMLCVIFALDRCTPAVGTGNGARVESVLVVRHDTIKVLKDSLRTKIVYIDTSRIDTVEKILDAEVPPIGDENICISENQLRECVKCKDSLDVYKNIVAIDSQTIDTLSNIAKTPQIEKTCTLGEQVKSFGMGTLFGITIRSFF